MQIDGYKAFNSDMTNRYGMKFEEGKTYHILGNIVFGTRGNGFHFCKNMEDVFRYIDDPNKIVAQVTGFGSIAEGFDDYNGYYDMYAASTIRINHILSREEVIQYMLYQNELAICRFIQTGYLLNSDEIALFRNKFKSRIVNNYLDYYALGDTDAFKKDYVKRKTL